MNSRQRIALQVGCVIILVLALFPPWRVESYDVIAARGDALMPCDFRAGRSFLFHPPEHVEARVSVGDARIDLPQLLAEWAVVSALTWLALSSLQNARPADTEPCAMQERR